MASQPVEDLQTSPASSKPSSGVGDITPDEAEFIRYIRLRTHNSAHSDITVRNQVTKDKPRQPSHIDAVESAKECESHATVVAAHSSGAVPADQVCVANVDKDEHNRRHQLLDQALVAPVELWKDSEKAVAIESREQKASRRASRLAKIVPPVKDPFPQKPIPNQHLQEDHYVEVVDRLIERDYFPDLAVLRIQHNLLNAERQGNVEAATALRQKLSSVTPATPAPSHVNDPGLQPSQFVTSGQRDQKLEVSLVDGTSRVIDLATVSLDKFQAQYTSEDNASFEAIVAKDKQRRREKEGWIEDSQRQHNHHVGEVRLAVQDGTQLQGELQHTHHEARSLLYFQSKHDPAGTKQHSRNSEVSLNRHNTRFSSTDGAGLFSNDALSSRSASDQQQIVTDADTVGAEGAFDLLTDSSLGQPPRSSGRVGFEFLSTPMLDPAESGASPVMTYGTVASTPLIINEKERKSSGNVFKIPEVPARDALAHKLANRALHKTKLSYTGSSAHSRTHTGSVLSSSKTRSTAQTSGCTPGDLLRKRLGLTPGCSSIGLRPTGRASSSAFSNSSGVRHDYSQTADGMHHKKRKGADQSSVPSEKRAKAKGSGADLTDDLIAEL